MEQVRGEGEGETERGRAGGRGGKAAPVIVPAQLQQTDPTQLSNYQAAEYHFNCAMFLPPLMGA